MELHQLEYVLAVVKYHHFSRAADAICISQSTLSQQVAKLEEELGVRLFERSTRAVSLTPAGKEFVSYATNVIMEITRAKRAMQNYVAVERGEVIIGAIPIIGMLGLTSVIASFQKAYPHLHLDIKEDASDRLWESLQGLEIDVALMTPPQGYEHMADFYFHPLLNDELVLIVNQGHPLSVRRIIDLSEVRHEKFIFMKENYGMRRISLDACHGAGFEPAVVYESSQVETIASLVAEGLGVSLLTSRVAKSLKRLSIATVRLHNAPTRITSLVIPKRSHNSPAVTAFCKYTLDYFTT